jgi:hypothetical protein
LTGSTLADVAIALVVGFVIWRVSTSLIRMLSTPPPPIDPEDVVMADQDYRCTVCGAELTMRMVNVVEDRPPRHCREDMTPVWRPTQSGV